MDSSGGYPITEAGEKVRWYWIGLNDKEEEGTFVWDSGHSSSDPFNISHYWQPNKPGRFFSAAELNYILDMKPTKMKCRGYLFTQHV